MDRLALPTIATVTITSPVISFASTLKKLRLLLGDEQCGPSHLATIIASDPMLTLALLSKANLAKDHGSEAVEDLQPAITVLGLNQVAGFLQGVRPIGARLTPIMASYWAAANACGCMATLIWEFMKPHAKTGISSDLARNASLLSYIGIIIAELRLGVYCQHASELVEQEQIFYPAALRQSLGLEYAAIGTLYTRSWHLPPSIIEAIRYMHRPSDAPNHNRLASIVHLARTMSRGFGFTTERDRFIEPMVASALDILDLRPADLEHAIAQFGDQLLDCECYESALSQTS